MKTRILVSTLLLGLAALPLLSQNVSDLPAAAGSALDAARTAAPGAVEKVEKQIGQVAGQVAGQAKATAKPKRDPFDPATWGKEEIHKIAVMDVLFGKKVQTVMFVLLEKDAPQTVANFISNADSNLYNGLAFHRAIDGYLVQTGDPLTADTGSRDRWGTGGEDRLPPEFTRGHLPGSVAMARRGDQVNPARKSNDSQFYFALGEMSSLDGQYTVFGQVVSGLRTLEMMSNVPTDGNDIPLERIEIKSLRVVDHKGPLVVARTMSSERRFTKPFSAKSGLERFIERIW